MRLEPWADDETIARLATGVKRFKLPDEFNPIKIYQAIAGDPETGHGEEALDAPGDDLRKSPPVRPRGRIPERSRELYGDRDDSWKKQRLNQILGNWGEFETPGPQPAGRGATVDFRFRNGRRVHFEAHEVLFGKLLKDVKEYISSSPNPLDWQQTDISNIGSRLVAMNERQYLGRSGRPVGPRPGAAAGPFRQADHRHHAPSESRRLPADRPMEGGNTSRIVVWLDDTVILKKPLANHAYYFVADARTGQPVPRPTSSCSAGARFRWTERTSSESRPRHRLRRPTMTASSRFRPPS